MEAVDFLMRVWGEQPGSYAALAYKRDTWHDVMMKVDDSLRGRLSDWIKKHDGDHVYFCPVLFSKPRRKKEFACRTNFLWGDIDDGDPNKFVPSVLWQSSPGRYAGLWRVKEMPADDAAELSRRIARYIGGDPGGWDVTQVLRIPGTHNEKYPDRPMVKLEHYRRGLAPEVPMSARDRWEKTIPRALLRRLDGPATGDRSEMLWKIENELAELGVPHDDILELVRASAWNKFAGRADEEERLRAELEKIEIRDPVVFVIEKHDELIRRQSKPPGWMVDQFWVAGSHGIVAGEPKSYKSTLTYDMLYSVASGTPFLDHRVQAGPVLIVQNENPGYLIEDRLRKYGHSRGLLNSSKSGSKIMLSSPVVPMSFINQQGFTLDDEAARVWIEDYISRERPVAVCLDPLYLMFSGDVSSAQDLAPVLQWSLRIAHQYSTALILVHHYGKSSEGRRGGQRMLGSTTLHGWVDSAWYLQVQEPGVVRLDREFRSAMSRGLIDLTMEMGDIGQLDYAVTVSAPGEEKEDFSAAILSYLETVGGPASLRDIAAKVALNRSKVTQYLEKLVEQKKIIRDGVRYSAAR